MTGGFVGGSGTLNYVAKWTPNGVTIGNSVMYDDGTNVGIGTNTPGSKFTVVANIGDGVRAQSSITGNYIILTGGNNSVGPYILSNFTLGIKTPDAEVQLGKSSGSGRALIYVDSSITTGLHISANSTGGNAIILDTNGDCSFAGSVAVNTSIASLGAELHVVGSGNTSATFGFRVDSSTVPNLFYVRNDGAVSSLNGYWINGSKVMYINPNSTTDNIFVGTGSGNTTMTGIQNTGLGSDVLTGLTSGIGNTGFGKQTLIKTNSGSYNTAIGLQAMVSNTTNDYNVAIGYRALYGANQAQNTAVGAFCLKGAAGLGNVGVGYDVMSSGTGGYNVGIGRSVFGGASYSASYNIGIGNRVGATITTGNYNVIIGYDSVFNVLTTGAQNTILGSLIAVDAADRTGSIALGYGAAITGNNQFVVGSAGVNAGTVTSESLASSKTWEVIINGNTEKILLV